MSGLYPKLDEPWSDVDEEEGTILEDYDQTSSLYHGGVGEDTETVDRDPLQSHYGSPGDATDGGVSLSEFEEHFLSRQDSRSGSHEAAPVLQRLHKKWHERNSPMSASYAASAGENYFPPIFGGNARNLSSSVGFTNRVWGVGVRAVQWTVAASLWKKAVLTVLLGVLCSMFASALRTPMDTHKLGEVSRNYGDLLLNKRMCV